MYGGLALPAQQTGLYHLSPVLSVLPSRPPHRGLLPAHLPASEEEERHGGAGQGPQSEEDQGFQEDQRRAWLHRVRVHAVLATTHGLQHCVRLEARCHPGLRAQCLVLRLPPHGHGFHLRQPCHLRVPQQQFTEGAQVHPLSLPLLEDDRAVRDFPPLRRQHRGDQRVPPQQRIHQHEHLRRDRYDSS